MDTIKIAIAGCGGRGFHAYGTKFYEMPGVEIVAIADICQEKRDQAQKAFSLTDDCVYNSAEEMLEQPQLADAMVIATPDRLHVKQAIPALYKGYHLLLEKPISPELDECRELVKAVEETGKQVVVCHVLRYTPYYRKLKEVLDSGIIGEVGSVLAYEDVGYWHQAHSFVRGNWRNSRESSPMILQKCCHDMDLYMWLLNQTCKRVSSFGNTFLFRKDRAPEGATPYCLDGCKAKETCPFDAERRYVTDKAHGIAHGHNGWPVNVVVDEPTVDTVMEALKKGPYGRCVYHCDNDVVDHQVVNLELENGSTMAFTMSGMTAYGGRWAKFMATEGQIVADMNTNTIVITRFGEEDKVIDISQVTEEIKGHGGGDAGIVKDFIKLLRGEEIDASRLTTVPVSTESHYMSLSAEESRLHNGKMIDIASVR